MPFNPIDGSGVGEPIPGTGAADHIRGLGGNDTVYGEGGNDLIEGGEGNDQLYGGTGRDTIRGGDGNDGIEGGPGSDRLYGGNGRDSFAIYSNTGAGSHQAYGGADDDRMYVSERVSGLFDGGGGHDTFQLFWYQIPDAVSGSLATGFSGGGNSFSLSRVERLVITTGSGDDTITGGGDKDNISVLGGANVVDAGGGDDKVTYLAGAANQLDGGDGNDLLRTVLHAGSTPVGFDFDGLGPAVTDGFGSTIVNFERFAVTGSYYDDTLIGGGDADRLEGIAGDDILSGMGGNDKLFGWTGDDHLSGGEGDDQLGGGAGLDTLNGGAGADSFVFRRPDGQIDVIEDFSGADGDTLAFAGGWYNLSAGVSVTLSLDAAQGTASQFIYDTTTGVLSFDADGTGGGASVGIAVLQGAPVLTAADFDIF